MLNTPVKAAAEHQRKTINSANPKRLKTEVKWGTALFL
jgi:hypothetical protein